MSVANTESRPTAMVTTARRRRATRSSSTARPMAAQPMKNEPCVLAQMIMISGMSHSSSGCLWRQARMAMTAAKQTTPNICERRARLVAATTNMPSVTSDETIWLALGRATGGVDQPEGEADERPRA